MTDEHALLLRRTITLAFAARAHGNHPFGALLADPAGRILFEAENTVVTEPNCTGHAETNLMRHASRQLPLEVLAAATLYTSTEPCPMCAGALYWGGVRRLVYCVSQPALYALMPPGSLELDLRAQDVFAHAAGSVEVIGPLLESEGLEAHAGFWS